MNRRAQNHARSRTATIPIDAVAAFPSPPCVLVAAMANDPIDQFVTLFFQGSVQSLGGPDPSLEIPEHAVPASINNAPGPTISQLIVQFSEDVIPGQTFNISGATVACTDDLDGGPLPFPQSVQVIPFQP